MKKSDSIVKISLALLKAQKEMEGAKKGSKNPFFKSSYADYNSVLEACKESLNNNGISVLQPHGVKITGDKAVGTVDTILLHESGEFLSSSTLVRASKDNDPQAFGSAVTYARRYGLQSLVSLPSEDDDGEGAMGRKKQVSSSFKKPAAKKVEKKEVKEEPKAEASGFRRKKKNTDDGF
jgi:hypothetical protein